MRQLYSSACVLLLTMKEGMKMMKRDKYAIPRSNDHNDGQMTKVVHGESSQWFFEETSFSININKLLTQQEKKQI